MTHLSLFSGIGGFDLAAHWAGFETIQFVERDPFCQRVLTKNFQGVPIHDDVTTFDGRPFAGRVDLVSAGFPCQPFSLAGKRLASGDERSLWGEVSRIVGEAKPKWVVGENVPGLLSAESGRYFGRVVNDLAALGYRVGWAMFPASFAGAVHRRRRIFIVANSGCVSEPIAAMERTEKESIWSFYQAIRGENWFGIELGTEKVAPSKWRRGRLFDAQPLLCRKDYGFSPKLDEPRLKALGNAVCPYQAYPILKAIAEASR